MRSHTSLSLIVRIPFAATGRLLLGHIRGDGLFQLPRLGIQRFQLLVQRGQNTPVRVAVPTAVTKARGRSEFERLVDDIATVRKVSKNAALEIARREHPVEFQRFQSG